MLSYFVLWMSRKNLAWICSTRLDTIVNYNSYHVPYSPHRAISCVSFPFNLCVLSGMYMLLLGWSCWAAWAIFPAPQLDKFNFLCLYNFLCWRAFTAMVSTYESIGFQHALYDAVICCLVLLLRLFCFVYCVCFSILSSLLGLLWCSVL